MPISDRVPDDSIEVADSEEEEGDVIVFRVGGSAAAAATVSALPQPAPHPSDAIASFPTTAPNTAAIHSPVALTPALIPSVVIPVYTGDASSNDKSKSSTDSQLARARKQAFESSSPHPSLSSSHERTIGQAAGAASAQAVNAPSAVPPQASFSPVATYRSSAMTHSGKLQLLAANVAGSSPPESDPEPRSSNAAATVDQTIKNSAASGKSATVKKQVKLSSPSRVRSSAPQQPPSPASSVDVLALEDSSTTSKQTRKPLKKGKTEAVGKQTTTTAAKRTTAAQRSGKSKAVIEDSDDDDDDEDDDDAPMSKAGSSTRAAAPKEEDESAMPDEDDLPGPSKPRMTGKKRAAASDSEDDFEPVPQAARKGKVASTKGQNRRQAQVQAKVLDDEAAADASDSLDELTPSPEASTKQVKEVKRGKKRENKKQRKAQLEKWQETVSNEEDLDVRKNKSPAKIRFQVSSEAGGTQESDAPAAPVAEASVTSTSSKLNDMRKEEITSAVNPSKPMSRAASTPGSSKMTSRPLISRGASESPSMIVDKNGNVKGFRTSRTDLPGVVASTGGVKSLGMSRRMKIPSLHTKIKTPPKKKPPLPIKPEKKKKDDDDDDDSEEELDEFGRPKIKPGHPDWWKIED